MTQAKIVEAVNSMITNKRKITDIAQAGKEYFFVYNGKYTWSISVGETNNVYFLHYYPNNQRTTFELADIDTWEEEEGNFVTFKTEEIKTREAIDSFRDLYQLLSARRWGLDDVLDDIISDSELPF